MHHQKPDMMHPPSYFINMITRMKKFFVYILYNQIHDLTSQAVVIITTTNKKDTKLFNNTLLNHKVKSKNGPYHIYKQIQCNVNKLLAKNQYIVEYLPIHIMNVTDLQYISVRIKIAIYNDYVIKKYIVHITKKVSLSLTLCNLACFSKRKKKSKLLSASDQSF